MRDGLAVWLHHLCPTVSFSAKSREGRRLNLNLKFCQLKMSPMSFFLCSSFSFLFKEKCSGVQGQVWRGEGESVSLCQVTDDVVHCSCLCYLNAEADHYRKPNIRCERDRSGWEARWSRLLLPCRQTCRWNGLKTNTVLTRVSFLSTFLSRLSVPRVRGGTVECSEIGEDRMQCNLR